MHWHNTERLHGYLGDVPPTEFETAHYAELATTSDAAGNQTNESPSNPGRFKRGLGHKRSLGVREYALGIEALERFVAREPLYRVHERCSACSP